MNNDLEGHLLALEIWKEPPEERQARFKILQDNIHELTDRQRERLRNFLPKSLLERFRDAYMR